MAMTKKKPAPAAARPRVTPASPSAQPAQPHQLALGFEDLKAIIGLVAKEAIDDFEFQSGDVRFHIRKGTLVLSSPARAATA